MASIPDPIPDPDNGTDLEGNVSACRAENPCEAAWQSAYAYASDKAYKLAVYQALQGVAFGMIQYASADRTADYQYEIADRQMVIAEEEYDRYKDVYVECENALAAEVCAITVPSVDYNTYADRALRDVRRQFGVARNKVLRTRTKYCMHDGYVDLINLEKQETMAVLAARDLGFRRAEERRDFLDNKRWERRVHIMAHGRDVMSGQSSMYQSGMGSAMDAVGTRGNATRELLGTLSGAVGSVLNHSYGPQINAPSVFGVGQNSSFNTSWGRFQNGAIHNPYVTNSGGR